MGPRLLCSLHRSHILSRHHSFRTFAPLRFPFSTTTTVSTPQPAKMHLVFDFDSTITKEDTISVLADSAVEFQRAHSGKDLKSTWETVVKAYLDDRKRHEDAYPIKAEDRQTFEQEMDFMYAMNTTELASLKRVGSSGIFEGLNFDTLFEMGVEARRSGRVVLRDGFEDFCRLALPSHTLSVVSVNWSRAFVMGVLHQAVHGVFVVANEVSRDGRIEGPALLGRPLTDASGKLEALKLAFSSQDHCMYFGDSTTDLACLFHESGIAICSDDRPSALLDTLRRIGAGDPPHVSVSIPLPSLNKTFYWARDFREVMDNKILEKATRV